MYLVDRIRREREREREREIKKKEKKKKERQAGVLLEPLDHSSRTGGGKKIIFFLSFFLSLSLSLSFPSKIIIIDIYLYIFSN